MALLRSGLRKREWTKFACFQIHLLSHSVFFECCFVNSETSFCEAAQSTLYTPIFQYVHNKHILCPWKIVDCKTIYLSFGLSLCVRIKRGPYYRDCGHQFLGCPHNKSKNSSITRKCKSIHLNLQHKCFRPPSAQPVHC